MTINIKALDTLFFKDGRPFSLGEESEVGGLFPPYPRVVYGALRSVFLGHNPKKLEVMNTKDDPTAGLEITHYSLFDGSDFLLPIPFDIVNEKNTTNYQILQPTFHQLNSSFAFPVLLNAPNNVESQGGRAFLSSHTLSHYLSKGKNPNQIEKQSDLWSIEPKTGIGRSAKTGTAKEGLLYQINTIRPNKKKSLSPIEIAVSYKGIPDLPTNGWMKLGGEGKSAHFKESENPFEIKNPEITNGYFKIYLSTPAFFKHGAMPEWIDKNTLEGNYGNLKLKLLSIATGRFISIGGFDMKARKPKPMLRAVPAGTVLYFKITEGTEDKIIENFHGKSISEFDTAKEGFGIGYVGFMPEPKSK